MQKDLIRFEEFSLDRERYQLLRAGRPLRIENLPLQLLMFLIERRGDILSREEIVERLWGKDVFLDAEQGINTAVRKIRLVLRDSPERPRYIQTVVGKGYRFIAPLEPELAGEHHASTDGIAPSNGKEHGSSSILPQVSTLPAERLSAASPFTAKLKMLAWLIVTAAITAGLAMVLVRPTPVPKLLSTVRLTTDRLQKWQPYLGPLIATDGPRVYFVERTDDGSKRLVEVPSSGGEVAVHTTPFINPEVADLDASHSEFLVLDQKPGSRDGDAWVFPLLSGEPRKLGDLSASDARWSPDRKSILFIRGSEFFIANADGTNPHPLLRVEGIPEYPSWSPDGKRIRFTLANPKTDSMSIWEFSPDGGNPHQLFTNPGNPPRTCCGTWTADGRYFVFKAFVDHGSEIWISREQRWWLLNNGAPPVRLAAVPIDYSSPIPSRDGKRIFVIANEDSASGELMRYDPNAKQFVPVSPGFSARDVVFSNDRKWMAYVSVPGYSLWRSRSDGTARQQLTFSPLEAQQPRWSPDGKQIAFLGTHPGRVCKMMLIAAQGGAPHEILPENANESDVTWSPDGNHLAFGRAVWGNRGMDAKPAIYIADLRTATFATLSGSDDLFMPRWSPDGKYLVAITKDLQKLILYNIATRIWTPLATGNVIYPEWSNDSKFVYWSTFGEHESIRRIRLADGNAEDEASLKNLQWRWSGIGLNNHPLIFRANDSWDVYALNVDLP
jgi:Tol biopolymer transport system component/DNA-binding winged helix-turn-helix (wHTH) protein